MKIAIVGTGIAGNVAAWKLQKQHEITVFEANGRIGGHTHTVDVESSMGTVGIDTGFIVFNDWTYPHFIQVLTELGVAWKDSDMSFSVQHHGTGLEYNGSSLNALFAQRSNLFKPSFYRMIRDILRFNREAPALLEYGRTSLTLGEFLQQNRYSKQFIDHFIIPMGAAIWSSSPTRMHVMPAHFFIRFFLNHGLLSVNDRPTWKVIQGGSRCYVDKLVAGHQDRIRLNSPVESIRRLPGSVEITSRESGKEHFDAVFLACHSDQALKLLADPSPSESEVLGSIRFQHNEAVLHTQHSLMPARKRAWAAWNCHLTEHSDWPVSLTYNMNILQGLRCPEQYLVTLNPGMEIDPAHIIQRVKYEHPIFTTRAVQAQTRQQELNSQGRTFYCGAWWRYGFHEDGVVSALNALEHFEQMQKYEQRDFQRAG